MPITDIDPRSQDRDIGIHLPNDINRLVARCVINDDDVPGRAPAREERAQAPNYQSSTVVGDDDNCTLNGRVFPLAHDRNGVAANDRCDHRCS